MSDPARLRTIKVAPNGHRKARKRPLRDTGIKFILWKPAPACSITPSGVG